MDFDPYDPCGMTLEHCHWFGWNVWIPNPNHVIQTASHQDIQVLIVIERLNALLKNAKDFLYLPGNQIFRNVHLLDVIFWFYYQYKYQLY